MSFAIGQYGAALLIVGIAAILGFVAEQVVVGRLRAIHHHTGSPIPRALASSFRGVITAGAIVIGARVALARLTFAPGVEHTAWRAADVAAIAVVTVLAARVAVKVVRTYMERGDTPLPATSIFVNITKGIVLVVGALMILSALGVAIGPLLTALGVGGLAIALALQDTLGNLFAGLQIIAAKQINPGDFIRLSTGEEGHVLDVTWRTTSIRQLSNDVVIVPNSVLASSLITNFSTIEPEHAVIVPVGVAYNSDLEHVERTVREVAERILAESEVGVREFEPGVRFVEFGESSIVVQAVLRSHTYADRYKLRHEFMKALHRRFAEESITIPLPIRDVRLRTEAGDGGAPPRATPV